MSLELKEENAGLARRNLAAAGFGSLAEYMIGPALDSLATLEAREERFDFFLSMRTKKTIRHTSNMR